MCCCCTTCLCRLQTHTNTHTYKWKYSYTMKWVVALTHTNRHLLTWTRSSTHTHTFGTLKLKAIHRSIYTASVYEFASIAFNRYFLLESCLNHTRSIYILLLCSHTYRTNTTVCVIKVRKYARSNERSQIVINISNIEKLLEFDYYASLKIGLRVCVKYASNNIFHS